jgi:hypothetical protein
LSEEKDTRRPKFFLHIGLEKTGSTAFQSAVASISEDCCALAQIAIQPPFTRTISSYDLTTSLCSDDMLGLLRRPNPSFLRQLASFLSENRQLDIIWSDEHLSSRFLCDEEIRMLASMLTSFGHKLVVIMVERDSEDWLMSKYLQSLKGGCTKKYSEFQETGFRNPLEHDVDYLKFLWGNNCYELVSINYGVDVVEKIFGEIEQRTGAKLSYHLSDTTINKSINVSTAHWLLLVNRIFRQKSGIRRLVVKVLIRVLNRD